MHMEFELTYCYEFLLELVWPRADLDASDWSMTRSDIFGGSSKHLISSLELFLILFSSLVRIGEHFALHLYGLLEFLLAINHLLLV